MTRLTKLPLPTTPTYNADLDDGAKILYINIKKKGSSDPKTP